MQYFRIEGGHPLSGTIKPSGNKNAGLPLLAAALLTDAQLTLENLPDIGDVRTKLRLLTQMGVGVEFAQGRCLLDASRLRDIPPERGLCSDIRTSVLLAAPLLARFGRARIGRPGGDRIGRRRLDTHLAALEAFGVLIEVEADHYYLRAERLRGCDLFLDEMSVTGTEQAVLAAVLAEGSTRIGNAAVEPHVQELCRALNKMGARIDGIGTHDLAITGVSSLHGCSYRVASDYMEVGSLIALAAATRSELRISDAQPENHRITQVVFNRLGVHFTDDGRDIVVPADQALQVQPDFDGSVPKIDDMPWPGFPPDLISLAVVLATQCVGNTLIHQKMFDRRLVFVDRLIDMGAGIVQCDPHRVLVMGAAKLQAARLVSPDIRAGMALVIAALAARGVSEIHNIVQIDRGYQQLDERLGRLGACISRVG